MPFDIYKPKQVIQSIDKFIPKGVNLVKGKIKSKYFDELTLKGFARPIGIHLVKDFLSEKHKDQRQAYSHRGKHIDIDVFDVSDIRSAIEELKAVSTRFETLIPNEIDKDEV